jgi:hypothetical protein
LADLRLHAAPFPMRPNPCASASTRRQAGEAARLALAHEGAVQLFSGGGVQVTPDGWSVNTTQPTLAAQRHSAAADGPATHVDPPAPRAPGCRCRRRRRAPSATR